MRVSVNWEYRFDSRTLKELGRALKTDLAGLRSYRVEEHRNTFQIQNKEVVARVVAVGHRRHGNTVTERIRLLIKDCGQRKNEENGSIPIYRENLQPAG